MNLRLSSLRLPLTPFTLQVDTTLRGRITALFGSSGAGKTTLLEIIAGLRRPAAGCVILDGETLTDTSARYSFGVSEKCASAVAQTASLLNRSNTIDAKAGWQPALRRFALNRRNARARIFVAPDQRAIGYVPQEGALFPHLNVRQNLLYGAHDPRNTRKSGGKTPAYEHVIEILEIAPLAERAIATLSGGEKQRVALGRALLSRPRLLLLDEPLAGLDAALKERLLPYLQKIRDEFGIPMIYVTHSSDEVMALCDEVLVLASGQIVRQGAPAEIFAASDLPRYTLRDAVAR